MPRTWRSMELEIQAKQGRIAELDERLRVQDQWRRELEAQVARLEKIERAAQVVVDAHDPQNPHSVEWKLKAALEEGKQDE